MTFVIIRDDLLATMNAKLPPMLDYNKHVAEDSLLNTSPTFGIYISGLVFDWIKAEGGVEIGRAHV